VRQTLVFPRVWHARLIQDPCVKVCVRSIMDKLTMEVCSMSHRVLEVCVKKYAAFRGKESRRLSMIILVCLHTQNVHFYSGIGGSRLSKLSALLKGSVCKKYVLEACSISHRVLEVCLKKYAASRGKEVDVYT